MKLEEILRCEYCKKTVRRKDTLIIYNRMEERNMRLCRDCQTKYFLWELDKKGIGGLPAHKMKLFSKRLEEGDA